VSEFQGKNTIIHEESTTNLYNHILNVVKKANIEASKHHIQEVVKKCLFFKKTKFVKDSDRNNYIDNLMEHDLFDEKNWDTSNLADPENILNNEPRLLEYKKHVPHPLSDQFDSGKHIMIYQEIALAFIQNRQSIYQDTVVDGLIGHYNKHVKKNEDIYEDNIKRIELFFNNIQNATVNRINKGVTRTQVNQYEIAIAIQKDLLAKKNEIDMLSKRVEILTEIINEPFAIPSPSNKPSLAELFKIDILSPLGVSTLKILMIIFKPLIYLGKGLLSLAHGILSMFIGLRDRVKIFSTTISNISKQPIFWFATLFIIINGILSLWAYSNRREDSILAFLPIIACVISLAMIPVLISKHLLEFRHAKTKKWDWERIEIVSLLSFGSISYLFFIIMYPILLHRYLHNVPSYISTIVGSISILASIALGFMNYRRLSYSSATRKKCSKCAVKHKKRTP